MDLSTTYLGLKLEHPLVATASPMTGNLAGLRRLAEAGAAAVVMESLFEEQIDLEAELLDDLFAHSSHANAEAVTYFSETELLYHRPEEYLDTLAEARRTLSIPIIASLNGRTNGGWLEYATKMEKAGASALELNLYSLPHDSNASSADIEARYLDVVKTVRKSVSIPVAVKLSPYFTAPAHFFRQLAEEGGVNGLVLFNRFYQPDFNLDTLEVSSHLELSRPGELRLPLTWIALLYGRVPVDFLLTSGVGSSTEVLKALLAGAKAVGVASEILRHGPKRIGEMVAEVREWLVEREYRDLAQMIGSMSHRNVTDPGAMVRANYMKLVQSWKPTPQPVYD